LPQCSELSCQTLDLHIASFAIMSRSHAGALLVLLLSLSSVQQVFTARLHGATSEDTNDIEEQEGVVYTAGSPPLCDKLLVRQQCKIMDSGNNIKIVSISELNWVTSTTRASMIKFLTFIGFDAGGNTFTSKEEFTCQELCEAIVDAIPPEARPPTSDVGCRQGQEGEDEVVCDVDVSPGALGVLSFDDSHEEFEAGHPAADGTEDDAPLSITGTAIKSANEEMLDLEPHQLLIRLANRFRIFPKLDIDVEEDVGEVELENETFTEEGEEGSLAEDGSAWGCSAALCRKYRDCVTYPNSCGGCRGCIGISGISKTTTRRTTTQAPWWTTRRPAFTTPKPNTVPQWLTDVETVSVKAQAYVARALETAPKAKALLKKWFGRTDRKTVQKVMFVLNSLSGMLGNVAYKKGPQCGPNTYAYVYPRGPNSKNNKDEFVFYLCSVYFRSDLGEKIETLTHEGSHHALAYTDDVWADDKQETKAYGRYTCKKLAKDYPGRAIKNADSHCYFINDLNGHS